MPKLPKLKTLSLKGRLVTRKNARMAAYMELIASISGDLDREKARLQLDGIEPSWSNFEQTPAYAEMFAGINGETIALGRKIWEGK